MGDVINLRRARKARERAVVADAAAEARARHGQTRAQKKMMSAETERLHHTVDQSRRERPKSGD